MDDQPKSTPNPEQKPMPSLPPEPILRSVEEPWKVAFSPKLLVFVALGFVAAALAFSFVSRPHRKPASKEKPRVVVARAKDAGASSSIAAPEKPKAFPPPAVEPQKTKMLTEVVSLAKKAILPRQAVRKKSEPSASFPSLILTGILFDQDEPLALINGKVVREGSMVRGVRVEEVLVDGVVVSFGVSRKILKIH